MQRARQDHPESHHLHGSGWSFDGIRLRCCHVLQHRRLRVSSNDAYRVRKKSFFFGFKSKTKARSGKSLTDWLANRFPIYALWHQATGSLPGATVLMVALLCVMMSALNAVHQTASRLTWSSARDDAIVLAKYLKLVHPRLHMPVYALLLNFVFCVIAGALYPASTSGMFLYVTSLEMRPR